MKRRRWGKRHGRQQIFLRSLTVGYLSLALVLLGMFMAFYLNDDPQSALGGVIPAMSGFGDQLAGWVRERLWIETALSKELLEVGVPALRQIRYRWEDDQGARSGFQGMIYRIARLDITNPKTFLDLEIPALATVSFAVQRQQVAEIPLPPAPVIPERVVQPEREAAASTAASQRPPDPTPTSPRLAWGNAPQVILFHHHPSEAYHGLAPGVDLNNPRIKEELAYAFGRWDYQRGVLGVGAELERLLKNTYGIPVLYQPEIIDYPVFSQAYLRGEPVLRRLVETNPQAKIIIDIHRDGGMSEPAVVTYQGERYAQVLFVVATGDAALQRAGRQTPWDWRSNEQLSMLLHQKLEALVPGISRGVRRAENRRYNQHLDPGIVLLEVGNNYNTDQEAKQTAAVLAQAVYEVLLELRR